MTAAGSPTPALKAYAGSAPVTRASGRSICISHRKVKNDRLAAAGFVWAFAASADHAPAREHYDRRDRGNGHPAALRHGFDRMLGRLYHRLQTGQTYDAAKAFNKPCHRHGEDTVRRTLESSRRCTAGPVAVSRPGF